MARALGGDVRDRRSRGVGARRGGGDERREGTMSRRGRGRGRAEREARRGEGAHVPSARRDAGGPERPTRGSRRGRHGRAERAVSARSTSRGRFFEERLNISTRGALSGGAGGGAAKSFARPRRSRFSSCVFLVLPAAPRVGRTSSREGSQSPSVEARVRRSARGACVDVLGALPERAQRGTRRAPSGRGFTRPRCRRR